MKLGGYCILVPFLLMALCSYCGVLAEEQTCSADDGDCSAEDDEADAEDACDNQNENCEFWASIGE
jgi:hypothetical protein